MQRRKKKKRVKPVVWLILVAIAFLFLVLACLPKAEKPQETVAPPQSQGPTYEVTATPEPSLAPVPYTPDEAEVEMLAQMLWGEARGIPSDMEKAACVWCVLNRVDDERGIWPDTVAGVLSQKN